MRWFDPGNEDWDEVGDDPPRISRDEIVVQRWSDGALLRQRFGQGAQRRWLWADRDAIVDDPDAEGTPPQ